MAASFWMILSFVLTGFSFYLLWSHFFKNKVKLSHVSFFLSLVLASQTFRSELIIGQFNGLLLFLLTCLMVYEKKGNDVLVGSFLGFCLSIKFFGAAFLIYYLFRGNIKVVVTSGLVFLASLGLSSLMISPQSVANYFTNVAPEVSKLYQADSFNISPLVLPQRIFGSDYPSAAEIAIEVDSLFSYPHLVEPLKYLLMAFLLLFSVFRANETRANNSRFGYLTVGSLAVLPNLWTHSLLVLIPFFALKFLGDDKPSLFHWLLLLLFFCGCYLPISIYSGERLSFWLGFATLTPSLIILLSIFTRDKISR